MCKVGCPMLPNCMHICYQFEQKPNRKVACVEKCVSAVFLSLLTARRSFRRSLTPLTRRTTHIGGEKGEKIGGGTLSDHRRHQHLSSK